MTDYDELLFGSRSKRLKLALKIYQKSQADFDRDFQTMKEWVENQTHFPETPSDAMITNFIILNKFNIDKCKANMDSYYSFRPSLPDFFQNKNPILPNMKLAAKTMCSVAMPKSTKEGYRVNYVRLMDSNADLVLYDTGALSYNIFELRLINDVMMGDIYVADLSNASMRQMFQMMKPIQLKNLMKVSEKVCKNLLKEIHFINVSNFVERFIRLFKHFVKLKIANRIYAHKDAEGLKKHLPIHLIPKEYGGNEYSLEDLQEMWTQTLEKYEYRFQELSNLKICDDNSKSADE